MSGPKLMGITCDEEVIRRNRERLQLIGKYKYFEEYFNLTNTDIRSTVTWVQEYGNKILNASDQSWFAISDAMVTVEKIKSNYVEVLQDMLLNNSIISASMETELNDIICEVIRAIPQIKEQFIEEIAMYIDEAQAEEHTPKESRDVLLKRRNEEIERTRKYDDCKLSVGFDEVDMVALNDANIYSRKREKKRMTLSDKIFIGNVVDEINEIKKDPIKYREYFEIISEIEYHLGLIDDEGELNQRTRAALSNIELRYQSLNKRIAYNQENERRSTFVRESKLKEYEILSKALGEEMCSTDITEEELENRIELLKDRFFKQEQREYIENVIDNIMFKYGYKCISTTNLHEYDKTTSIFFEDGGDNKLRVSLGEGMMMIQVVGEGENEPTEEEVNNQLEQQGALCTLYPEIKEELKNNHINIKYENCEPISREFCRNVKIDRANNDSKVKHRSVLNRTFSSNSYTGNNANDVSKLRYMNVDND